MLGRFDIEKLVEPQAELSLAETQKWLNSYKKQALELEGKTDTQAISQLLWPYSDFLQGALERSSSMEVGEIRQVEICGQEFTILRQDNEAWPSPANCILPAGNLYDTN